MLLMQYRHRLPADYDLARIRARATGRGPSWDETPGLAFKAFLLDGAGEGGAAGYASLYLWRDPWAATAFLTDPRFAAVVATFGRPLIATWLPLDAHSGMAERPAALRQDEERLAPATDMAALARREAERSAALLSDPGTVATMVGLDPSGWRLTRFTLLAEAPAGGSASEVLHLAKPGWSALPHHS